MSIAVASVMQESNDFSPVKTRYEDFGFLWGPEALVIDTTARIRSSEDF